MFDYVLGVPGHKGMIQRNQVVVGKASVICERRQSPFGSLRFLYGGFDLQQPTTFWKREIFRKAGEMDPSFHFAFDRDLFFRFIPEGARFSHIPRAMAGLRNHPTSKSSTKQECCERELKRLRETHLRYPESSVQGTFVRTTVRVPTAAGHISQGGALGLLRRVPNRLKSRNSETIVGLKAKWIR
ncbi:MAG TPA: hypothetical protein VK210_15495 [Terriglobia bacterium]|nr:hypothetical protein [Terriglobia bacterium]